MINSIFYPQFYINQLGEVRGSGKKYLIRILNCYLNNGGSAGRADYDRLIAYVAEEQGVQVESVTDAIARYVKKSWATDFSWEWRQFTGWKLQTPPHAKEAIRLVCEHYAPFLKTYGPLIRTAGTYYIRSLIEPDEQ